MQTRTILRGARNAITDFSPWRDRRRIGFMHIPKTSGTAMMEAIGRRVRTGRSVLAADRVLFGDFDSFGEFAAPISRTIYREPRALPAHADLICGHVSFSTLRIAGRSHLMTVLREPRSRLLSHWMFWRNHTDEHLARIGSWGDRVRLARRELTEFLSNPAIACQTDNLATRMLLWPHPLIPVDGFIGREADAVLLREARARLDGFDFVDLVENPAMQGNLAAWLGDAIHYPFSNTARPLLADRRTDLREEMTRPARALLAARSRLDAELWTALAQRRLGEAEGCKLGAEALNRTISRLSVLAAGSGEAAPAVPVTLARAAA